MDDFFWIRQEKMKNTFQTWLCLCFCQAVLMGCSKSLLLVRVPRIVTYKGKIHFWATVFKVDFVALNIVKHLHALLYY